MVNRPTGTGTVMESQVYVESQKFINVQMSSL